MGSVDLADLDPVARHRAACSPWPPSVLEAFLASIRATLVEQ